MFFRLAVLCGIILTAHSPGRAQQPAQIELPGIEHAFKISDRLYSGGQPENEAALAELRKLGVKTIISVDGTKPDAEIARRLGMRYVHLPHGYDGISSNTVLSLIKVARTLEGPFYIHCHHGKHRGPAAAAVICRATMDWTADQATAWLHQAGTSTNYPGLFKASTAFVPPPAAALASVSTNFPEVAQVSGLVEGMVEVDKRWEHLKAVQQAGWAVPPKHPDLVPSTEALLLQEAYRELQRAEEPIAKGPEFLDALASAERAAAALSAFLSGRSLPLEESARSRGDELATTAAQSCSTCHKKYRN